MSSFTTNFWYSFSWNRITSPSLSLFLPGPTSFQIFIVISPLPKVDSLFLSLSSIHLSIIYFWDRISSLCSLVCPGTHHIDQGSLQFTDTCMPLHPESHCVFKCLLRLSIQTGTGGGQKTSRCTVQRPQQSSCVLMSQWVWVEGQEMEKRGYAWETFECIQMWRVL